MQRLVLSTALVVAAFLPSSCGGGGSEKPLSRSDYETQIGAILRPLQETTLPRVIAVSPANRDEAVRRLKAAEATVHDDADKLAAMRPPPDAARPTSQIAQALAQIGDELTGARRAGEHGDFAKLEQFKVQIATDPAVAQIRDAVVQLVNLDYNVAGSGP